MNCSVPNCTKPIKRTGFCYGHYMKNWRYGTPTPTFEPKWQDIRGQRFGSLVVTDVRMGRYWICQCDCGATTKGDAGNLNRGTLLSCGNSKLHHRLEDVTYSAIHSRLAADFGPAKAHQCIDCDRTAAHWSYNHDDPAERIDYTMSERGIAYSLHLEHYSPRCVPCHKRYDLDRINGTEYVKPHAA